MLHSPTIVRASFIFSSRTKLLLFYNWLVLSSNQRQFLISSFTLRTAFSCENYISNELSYGCYVFTLHVNQNTDQYNVPDIILEFQGLFFLFHPWSPDLNLLPGFNLYKLTITYTKRHYLYSYLSILVILAVLVYY